MASQLIQLNFWPKSQAEGKATELSRRQVAELTSTMFRMHPNPKVGNPRSVDAELLFYFIYIMEI